MLILSFNGGENNGKSGNEPLLYYSHLKQEISIIVRFSVVTAGATNMRLRSSLGWGSDSGLSSLTTPLKNCVYSFQGSKAMACSFSANVSSQRTLLIICLF